MKSTPIFILLVSLMGGFAASAQTYETRTSIRFPSNLKVTKTVRVKGCKEPLKKGSVVTTEYTRKRDGRDITVTHVDTVRTDSDSLLIDKEVTIDFPSLPGRANLSVDEKDKSLIHINYWLNPENKISAGTKFRIIKKAPDCAGNFRVVSEDSLPKCLDRDTTFWLKRAGLDQTNEKWFTHSDIVVAIYKKDTIHHYLVNKYDRNGTYTFRLENRAFISLPKCGFEFGAVTIPLKYRFGTSATVDGVKRTAKNEFIADANIGLFGGWKMARYRVRNEGGKLRDLSALGVTVGTFLGLSSTTIDSLSTHTSRTPLQGDEKYSIGVISPGFGLMLSAYNVQIGGFLGWDFGFGSNGAKWNFHGRPWLGFGLGYSLSNFWKS